MVTVLERKSAVVLLSSWRFLVSSFEGFLLQSSVLQQLSWKHPQLVMPFTPYDFFFAQTISFGADVLGQRPDGAQTYHARAAFLLLCRTSTWLGLETVLSMALAGCRSLWLECFPCLGHCSTARGLRDAAGTSEQSGIADRLCGKVQWPGPRGSWKLVVDVWVKLGILRCLEFFLMFVCEPNLRIFSGRNCVKYKMLQGLALLLHSSSRLSKLLLCSRETRDTSHLRSFEELKMHTHTHTSDMVWHFDGQLHSMRFKQTRLCLPGTFTGGFQGWRCTPKRKQTCIGESGELVPNGRAECSVRAWEQPPGGQVAFGNPLVRKSWFKEERKGCSYAYW